MSKSHNRNHEGSVETFEAMILMSAAAAEVDLTQADQASNGDDFLISTEVEGRLDGAAGNDILLGASGDNALDGGSGDDILIPVRGDNVLSGGEGFDRVLYLEGVRADYVVSDLGFGIIEVAGGGRADLLFGVESVIFADGSIAVDLLLTNQGGPASGSWNADTGSSNVAAADFVDATDGADHLLALSPGVSLEGLGGRDLLAAVAGDNFLSGDNGEDVFVTVRGDNFIDGGSGDADLALYTGSRADYKITDLGDESIHVQNDQVSDIIVNTEWLSFADGDVLISDLTFDAVQLPVVVQVLEDVPTLVEGPFFPDLVDDFEQLSSASGIVDNIPEEIHGQPVQQLSGVPLEIAVASEGSVGREIGSGPIPDDSFNGTTSPGVSASSGFVGDGPANEVTTVAEAAGVTGFDFTTGLVATDAGSGFSAGPDFVEGNANGSGGLTATAHGTGFNVVLPTGVNVLDNNLPVQSSTGVGTDFGLPTGSSGPESQSGFGVVTLSAGSDVMSGGGTGFSSGSGVTTGGIPVEPNGGIGDGAGPIPGSGLSQTSGDQEQLLATATGDQASAASVVNGTDQSEWISGTEQNDYVVAGAGDDEIRDAFGFNVIDGGDGTDTLVVYEGTSADFTVTKLFNGSVFLAGKGMDGLDLENVLIDIERIVFNDREILTADIPVTDISVETNASSIARSSLWFGGTEGDDTLVGSEGDDQFYAPLGNNAINGGAGIDTLVIYEGEISSYFLGRHSDGRTFVKGPGLNGGIVTQWLTDVERIVFNDGEVLTSSITDVVDVNGQLVS